MKSGSMGKLIPPQTPAILNNGLKTRLGINARNEGGVCTRSGPQESIAFEWEIKSSEKTLSESYGNSYALRVKPLPWQNTGLKPQS